MAATSGDNVGAADGKPKVLLVRQNAHHAGKSSRQPRPVLVRREIIIGHGEETYRLRLTSQNKLILTK